MFSFTRYEKRQFYEKLDSIREALIHLMATDKEFNDSISYYTNNSSTVRTRFEKWLKILEEVIGRKNNKSERCFSFELKMELFKDNPICALCNQRIIDIDDAQIDHVLQYWKGGETIPQNARLTHRFCNLSRSIDD